MTIEFSLRRRAKLARLIAVIWLALATAILTGASGFLPCVATQMLESVSKGDRSPSGGNAVVTGVVQPEKTAFSHAEVFVVVIVALGFFGVAFVGFLLGRASLFEMALAARLSGMADALCIVSNDVDELEKAAGILVPKAKHLSVPEILSAKDIRELVEVLKLPR
jgi:hypothetical protein